MLAPGKLAAITDLEFVQYAKSDLVWPKVFMTGDGHSTPAFAWTNACPRVTNFFAEALAANRLHAYVEVRPADVAARLVPGFLAGLHAQGRIIGWELALFEQLLPSMEMSLNMMALEVDFKNLNAVGKVLTDFYQLMSNVPEILGMSKVMDVATFGYVNVILECLDKYMKDRTNFTAEVANKLTETAKKYYNACMGLRCCAAYHQAVGAAIQRNMLQTGDSIHLITCGDAHLTCADPLQNFIGLDIQNLNALGWIDPSQG
jgi:hypothetical protein